jgi:hypothetical protein
LEDLGINTSGNKTLLDFQSESVDVVVERVDNDINLGSHFLLLLLFNVLIKLIGKKKK